MCLLPRCLVAEGSARAGVVRALAVAASISALGAVEWAGVACGGGRSRGSFESGIYRNGPIAFRVPEPPQGWRRIEANDASLAFRDEPNAASVLINARCLTADDRTP